MIKLVFVLAIIGHILCGVSDCLLGYTAKGRLDIKDAKDPVKMADLFKGTPTKNSLIAIVMGAFAIALFGFGYFGISFWMKSYSAAAANVMFISTVLFLVLIVVHHVICGFVEWLFIRLDLKADVLEALLEFQKKTIITMFGGYAALMVFLIVLFVMIVTGKTDLPWWCCIFNTLVFVLAVAPTKIPAKGNIAGALMYIGFLIMV